MAILGPCSLWNWLEPKRGCLSSLASPVIFVTHCLHACTCRHEFETPEMKKNCSFLHLSLASFLHVAHQSCRKQFNLHFSGTYSTELRARIRGSVLPPSPGATNLVRERGLGNYAAPKKRGL